jgi:NADH-dependent peroxiredoxin subunit F
MLDANLTQQLKGYLANIREPIELVASLGDDAKSRELGELLDEIAALSDKVALVEGGDDARKPSFLIRRVGTEIGVRFAGLPMGHEFTSLVLALLQVGGHPSKAAQELIEQVRNLDGDFAFETYFSLSCQNCPDVVQALNLMAVLNPRITHVSIDGGLFPAEVEARKVMAVPTVFLNGEPFASGRMELEQIVAKIDTGAAKRTAEKIAAKEPFEVLVVGGDAGADALARRIDRRRALRRPGRRGGGDLCGAQGHPHRHRRRALRRPGA